MRKVGQCNYGLMWFRDDGCLSGGMESFNQNRIDNCGSVTLATILYFEIL